MFPGSGHSSFQPHTASAVIMIEEQESFLSITRQAGVLNRFKHQVLIVLITLLILLVVPVPLIFLLLLPSLALRGIVKGIAGLYRPDLSHIFNGKGALMALESVYSRPKLTLLVHFVCEGTLDLDKFRLRFQERVINHCDEKGNLIYRQLRQIWTPFLGFYFWKWDRRFNLDHHVRLYDYTEPGVALPTNCTENDVRNVTNGILGRPFVEGRSPWEILLVPNYEIEDGRKGCVVVFRVHHALADGYSILKMFLWFMGKEEAGVPKPNRSRLSYKTRVLNCLTIPFRLPYDTAVSVVNSFDGPNCWHLTEKKLSRKYHTFFSDPVPVEKIKEIKVKHDVGYNAVVYAVTAGAIRKLMQEAGQEVPTSMACAVPFPLPGHPGGLVVHASAICFKFSPTVPTAVGRLKEIADSFNAIQKAPSVPFVISLATDVITVLPICLMRLFYNKFMMSLVMSNFPGPATPIEFMGTAKVVDLIPAMGHMPGKLGAAAILLSIAGRQRIVLTTDQDLFKGYKVPTNFSQMIQDEVEELLHT